MTSTTSMDVYKDVPQRGFQTALELEVLKLLDTYAALE